MIPTSASYISFLSQQNGSFCTDGSRLVDTPGSTTVGCLGMLTTLCQPKSNGRGFAKFLTANPHVASENLKKAQGDYCLLLRRFASRWTGFGSSRREEAQARHYRADGKDHAARPHGDRHGQRPHPVGGAS